ncbi:MAG: biotin-independent malonate decarboxylase subunit gamma [Desulfuromonadales bacterium]|jgi:malonate decarboxylase gamma subunit
MKIESLLKELFPEGHAVEVHDGLITGFAATATGEIAVMGTADHLAIGVESALALAGFVLEVVRERPGNPLLMLVDTQGQRLSRKDELLGINGYLAHLVKCLELARLRGHRLLSLVYDEAVSGGFLSFGLMADEIHALPDAKVRVMNLPAMARVTKLPLEMLQELSGSSPAFAPGVENFFRLGGVQSLWKPPLAEALSAALGRQGTSDHRRDDGLARQGRQLAGPISRQVLLG